MFLNCLFTTNLMTLSAAVKQQFIMFITAATSSSSSPLLPLSLPFFLCLFNTWLLIVMLWKVMAITKPGMMSHIKRCYHNPHEPHVHKLEFCRCLSQSNIWVFLKQLILGSMLIPANCKSISAVLHCKRGDELRWLYSSVNQWLITCLLTTWTLQGKPTYEGHAESR